MSGSQRVVRGPIGVGALVLALALLATVLAPSPTAAHAHEDLEVVLVALVNEERARAGLPSLEVAAELTAVGRDHSTTMAIAGELHHNPGLGDAVTGWRKVGENVGVGPAAGELHAAFMASPDHARNVLDAQVTQVGIGVTVRDGRVWATQLFRDPR